MPSVKISPITLATEKPRRAEQPQRQHRRRPAAGRGRRTPAPAATATDQRAEHRRRGPAVVVAVDDAPDAEEDGAAEQQRADAGRAAARRRCDSATASSSSGTATSATGTLSQKIACQLTPSTTAPPMTGPSATPRPETPPQMPIAAARIAGGHGGGEQGQRQRHDRGGAEALDRAGRDQRLGGGAQRARRSRPAVNSAMPASIIRRRPSRSPSVAAGSMKVAKRERVGVQEPRQLADRRRRGRPGSPAARWSSPGCRGWP